MAAPHLSSRIAAAAAIETLPEGVRPVIQSDHGSGFIAGEFANSLIVAQRRARLDQVVSALQLKRCAAHSGLTLASWMAFGNGVILVSSNQSESAGHVDNVATVLVDAA